MSKPKASLHEQGFTLTEVLVASLVIVPVFVATAMQAVVIAAAMKVQAKKYAEATTWIQEDIESVRYRATEGPFPNQLPYDSTKCNSYGNYLQGNLPEVSDSGSKIIAGKNFTLSRSANPNGNVLQLTYAVTPQGDIDDDPDSIATLYTEVIPDAAFKCP